MVIPLSVDKEQERTDKDYCSCDDDDNNVTILSSSRNTNTATTTNTNSDARTTRKNDNNDTDNDNDAHGAIIIDKKPVVDVIMAPMVRGSELAFRMMVRERSTSRGDDDNDNINNHHISLCYSPMLRANEVIKAYNYWEKECHRHDPFNHNNASILRTTTAAAADDTATNSYNVGDDARRGEMEDHQHYYDGGGFFSPVMNIHHELPKMLHEDGILFLTDTCPEDRPLVVQLCGNCPTTLYQATQAVLERYSYYSSSSSVVGTGNIVPTGNGPLSSSSSLMKYQVVEGIDLNLGCPQSCARDGKFGAFLVDDDPEMAVSCVAAMRRAIDDFCHKAPREVGSQHDEKLSPVSSSTTLTTSQGIISSSLLNNSDTCSERMQQQQQQQRTRLSCKMRLLDTLEETITFAKRLEEAGCDVLAVHCRQRVVKHNGKPDVNAGRTLIEALSIPVLLNGTIQTVEDISTTMQETGASAVMVGRALLENPYLLRTKPTTCCIGDDDDDSSTLQFHNNSTQLVVEEDPGIVASDYLDFAEKYPPPSFLYIQRHLRWIFRARLEPPPPVTPIHTNKSSSSTSTSVVQSRTERKRKEHVIMKACYSDWRHRIWTFLVRPYLETIDQFRRVVLLYILLYHGDGDAVRGQTKIMAMASPSTVLPHSLRKLLDEDTEPPSFHSIRHNYSSSGQDQDDEHAQSGLAIFG